MSKSEVTNKNRFVISKSMAGKGLIIKATFKGGKTVTYDVDKVFEEAKSKLESMPCWEKYGNYTSTTGIPSWAKHAVIE